MLSAATEDEEYVPEKAVSGLQGRVDCFEKAEQAALCSAEGFLIPGRHPGRMRNRMRHMNSVKHWSKSNFILASVLALLTFFLSACSTGRAAYSGSSEEAASSEEMIMPETTSSAAVNEHSEAPGSEITGEIPEGVKDSNMQQVQSPETGNFDFTSQTVLFIDLMLIHQPGADDKGVYKAMEDPADLRQAKNSQRLYDESN